jgi:hypothetical protein
MKCDAAIRKRKILSFRTIGMKLEDIIPSGTSQRKTNTIWCHLSVEPKNVDSLETDSKREIIEAWKMGKMENVGQRVQTFS